MEPLLVRQSRWRFMLLALLMLPFALLGPLLITDDDLQTRLSAVFCIVLFGGFLVFSLIQVFRRRPVLVLNDTGIEDTRLKTGVIPWNEVERAYELPYLWYKNVQVVVRHPAPFKQRQPWLTRTLDELNALSGWAPFVLVTSNTDTPASVVVDYIYRQLLRQWPVPAPNPAPNPAPAELDEY